MMQLNLRGDGKDVLILFDKLVSILKELRKFNHYSSFTFELVKSVYSLIKINLSSNYFITSIIAIFLQGCN